MGEKRTASGRSVLGKVLAVSALLALLVLSGCAAGYTQQASEVTDTTATFNGQVVSTESENVEWFFRYGRTSNFGKETQHSTITINDRDAHSVSKLVGDLNPGTTYHYTICTQGAGDPLVCNGSDRTFQTTGTISQLSIEAQPSLYPDFNPAVSDYVTRCGSKPVQVAVAAPQGTTVSVAGRPAASGSFTEAVQLTPGKRFDFVTNVSGTSSTYHVRCLPGDFPAWTYTRQGTPSAPYYIVAPQGSNAPGGTAASRYVAIFDGQGVPIWWKRADAIDAKLTPDGNLTWFTLTSGGSTVPGYEVHRLDGSLVRLWRTVGSDTDNHDIQLLDNGNALLISYVPRPGTIDLSPYGGPSTNATVTDAVFQEVTPTGSVVWSWNSKDHIPLSETPSRWWPVMPIQTTSDGRQSYDYVHANSIQRIGGTIIASFRHLDADYALNRTTGDIIWKLGGTHRAQSLTVLDDPQGDTPLGGAHYARVLPDGTLTLYDNNTFFTFAPRAVRYRLNLFDNTARLIEQVNDPAITSTFCCGSAERLDDGSWLVDWASNPLVTETGPTGSTHFRLSFDGGLTYRVASAKSGSPSIASLRAGMDAQAGQ